MSKCRSNHPLHRHRIASQPSSSRLSPFAPSNASPAASVLRGFFILQIYRCPFVQVSFQCLFSYFFISLNGINETPLRSVFVVTIHIFELCKVSVFFLILSLPFKTQTRIWKSIKLIVLEILYFHHHNHRHHLLAISGCVFARVLQWHSSGIFFEKRLQVRVYFA